MSISSCLVQCSQSHSHSLFLSLSLSLFFSPFFLSFSLSLLLSLSLQILSTSILATNLDTRTLANVEIFLLAPAASNSLTHTLLATNDVTVGQTTIEASAVTSVTSTGAVTAFTCRVSSGTFTASTSVFLGAGSRIKVRNFQPTLDDLISSFD